MPIATAASIQICNREAFHDIDRHVTGLAFKIQNELGRYLEEAVYQHELARRCIQTGLDVIREFQMTVSLADFTKCYFADLLINHAVIVETKATESLTRAHSAQTLNYLFLCGIHHGTLLNFRTNRVQHEFVSTSITSPDRQAYDVRTAQWRPLSSECDRLQQITRQLLKEWGACLDTVLYRDAIVHFLGGGDRIDREVTIYSHQIAIGVQRMKLLSDEIAFSITAATRDIESVREHQYRLLQHTKLRALQWINFNRNIVTFHTITP